MKKLLNLLSAGLILALLVSCGGRKEENNTEEVKSVGLEEGDKEKTDLTVFAAASMTESLNEIKEAYEKENPKINLVYNFDSSGTLKTQIESGASCDLFISAAQKQMDQLDPQSGKVDSDIHIDPESRVNLLENKVVLAISQGEEDKIKDFMDLATDKVETLALGNDDVPVGQYSRELLKNLGLWEKVQDKVSYAGNVKEVTTRISENTVDCGIIYETDAKVAGLEVVAEADDSMLDNRVVYPAAVLEESKNKKEAEAFLTFLKKDQAQEIFKAYGFSPIK